MATQTHANVSNYYAAITERIIGDGAKATKAADAGCEFCGDESECLACGDAAASAASSAAAPPPAAGPAAASSAPTKTAAEGGCDFCGDESECRACGDATVPAATPAAPAPAGSGAGASASAPPLPPVVPPDDAMMTSCCAVEDERSPAVAAAVANLHKDVSSTFYGCGSPLPPAMSGASVIDLGSGTGFDVYVASQLVGESGSVVGIDMTDTQLNVARKYQDWHAQKFGHAKSNVTFRKGVIEDLRAAGIEDDSFDVAISNCVINLCPDKEPVLREIHRVLKPGGELYFGDVYADRRFPEELVKDAIFFGECISGALYTEDFRRIMQRVGFVAYWPVTNRELEVGPKLRGRMGSITCYSSTIRAIKVDGLEDCREDYGQTATFKGSEELGESFVWDLDTTFERGVATRVDGNTALAITASRYAPMFDVTARGAHLGRFLPDDADGSDSGGGGAAPPKRPKRDVVLFDVSSLTPAKSKTTKQGGGSGGCCGGSCC